MASQQRIRLARGFVAALLVAAGVVSARAAELPPNPEFPALSARVMTFEALRLLAGLGYDPGVVDESLTTNIDGAVRDFQRSKNLKIDGEVTDALLASLRKAKQ